MTMREYICYHPPKSSTWGHTLRHRTVRSAWQAIERFLDACTIAEPPRLNALTVHADFPFDEPPVAPGYVAAVTASFGQHDDVSRWGLQSPSGEYTSLEDLIWRGERLEWSAVMAFLSAHEPWPKRISDPVSASVEVCFQWRDPESGELLAHQNEGFGTPDGTLWSTLRITLGARTLVQPDIRIPFAEGSPRLPDFVKFVQSAYPATLKDQHFRVATPNAKRTGYQFRRLVISPFVAL